MIYGTATVEILCRKNDPCMLEVVETTPYGAVWGRFEVSTFVRDRDGYVYQPTNGRGASGWTPAANVRNFRQTETSEERTARLDAATKCATCGAYLGVIPGVPDGACAWGCSAAARPSGP